MTPSPPKVARLPRNSLTRALIVEAAMSIFKDSGRDGLTFNRLGASLGASSTAVYRHFQGRAEILEAVTEELDRISLEGYEPSPRWQDSLLDLALRAWETAEKHPAAAANSFFIATGGDNELRAVDAVLQALHEAGYRGTQAVLYYQVFSNMVLGSSISHAGDLLLALESGQRIANIQRYSPAQPELYPFAGAVKDELSQVDRRKVYIQHVSMLITSFEQNAPRD
jgi:AcrR family transcriptional regulator